MDITNSSGSAITINRFYATWVKTPTSQKIDKLFLNGVEVWNKSDPDSPSDIPAEGTFVGLVNPAILDATPVTLLIQFSDPLQPIGYEVHIVFDLGCQVIGVQ